MSETTTIEWTDATFNPWWGCAKVSPACDHCYAERDAKRFAPGRVLWGVGSDRRTFDAEGAHWKAPATWAARGFSACTRCGWRGEQRHAIVRDAPGESMPFCPDCDAPVQKARRRVFCASMADWLDLDAPIAEFVRLLDTIRQTPELDWLLLSKRIGNWRKRLDAAWAAAHEGNPELGFWIRRWLTGLPDGAPANVVLMATVINQPEADRDLPKLFATPARRRGVSIEPMLGPIDLSKWLQIGRCQSRGGSNGLEGRKLRCGLPKGHEEDHSALIQSGSPWFDLRGDLHWVIAGGESGPHARPAHPDWFRSLRDQCAAAGVPFLLKQHGEWIGCETEVSTDRPGTLVYPDDGYGVELEDGRRYRTTKAHGREFVNVGKKDAGRLLDGVTHDGAPTP